MMLTKVWASFVVRGADKVGYFVGIFGDRKEERERITDLCGILRSAII